MTLKDPVTSMPLFTTLNHSAQTYVRNSNLWCKPIENQICSIAAWKSQGDDSFGGTLISPRHVLYCAHAFPNGRPPGASSYVQRTIRFVKQDGTVVNAKQIADRGSAGHNAVHSVGNPLRADLAVGLLDRDMTQEGFVPIPIAVLTSNFVNNLTQLHHPTICFSQGVSRQTSVINPNPPELHTQLAYVRSAAIGGPTIGNRFYTPFSQYRVWNGDSGTPQMLLFNGMLFLFRILTSSMFTGPQPGQFRETVEDLISRVEVDSGESITEQPTFMSLSEIVATI